MLSIIEYYRDHRAEIDVLADSRALFVLAFSAHVNARSLQELANELQWTRDEVGEVCERLRIGQALEIGRDQESLSITSKGRRALEMFQSVVPQSEKQFPESDTNRLLDDAFRFETSKEFNKAVDAYKKALKLNPRAPEILVNLGSLHFRNRELTLAAKYYRAAIENRSGYAMAYFNLGCVYHEANNAVLAEAAYLGAITSPGGYPDAHYNLAVLYSENGRRQEAIPHWISYLKIDRDSRWAEVARNQLPRPLSLLHMSPRELSGGQEITSYSWAVRNDGGENG